jgi:hypothetical protein
MFKFTLFSLLTLTLIARASDVFEHVLKSYPSHRQSCETLAKELSDKFSDAAKVEIYFAGGTKSSDTECDIKIAYVASEQLSLPATIDRNSLSAVEWRGIYADFESCEKSLEFEKELFTKETGLSPWLSFCATETSVTGKNSYYPVVEAIGNPAKQFFGSETMVGGTPVIGWEKALQEIKEGAVARGITAPTVHGFSIGAAFEVRIRFYSQDRQWLINDKFGKFTEAATCESQIAHIKSGLPKAQIAPLAALCAKDFEGYILNIVNLTPDIIKSVPIWERIDPKTYNSLGECLANVSTTEKTYAEKFNKKVLTGFCFNSSPKVFQVMILEDSFK